MEMLVFIPTGSSGEVSRGPGAFGEPQLYSQGSGGAIWVTYCCKCSREACEDLSQRALPLPSMRRCRASEKRSGEEPCLGLGLTQSKPPAALSCNGNVSTHVPHPLVSI